MTTLRQLFLVDKLRQAAESKDALRLGLVREIIKQVKLSQLDHVQVATDSMMIELLEKLRDQKHRELKLMEDYLEFAHKNSAIPRTKME